MADVPVLERRVRDHLAQLEADGLHRVLRAPAGIDLSSNDYLGLASHPSVKAHMMRAVAEEGCGSTGSRLLRGEREAFSRLERRFAAFKGAERSLYFSSGYLANLAVLTTLPRGGDVIFSDERNHASLIDGIRWSAAERVVFPHNDVAALARLIDHERPETQKFIVTESLFSMDGDRAPLAGYASLCRSTRSALIVDEAHAVGLYGRNGTGLIDDAGVGEDVLLSIDTAGKALGASGAFVTGPAWAVEYLIQRARPFIFSTAPPPSLAAALEAAITVIETEPDRRELLGSLVRYLRRALERRGIAVPDSSSQIVPILIGEPEAASAVAAALQAEGFDVRAIRPPSVPQGTARLRVSVNVGLTESVIDAFVDALAAALARVGPCSKAYS
jgi:8-amino-7-oxononanoate synthase